MDRLLPIKKLLGHSGIVSSIAVSPRGDVFATGAHPHQGVEREIRLWDLAAGQSLREIATGLNAIFGLCVSPDSNYLVVGGGGTVCDGHWVYTSGVEVWRFDKNNRVARFGEDLLFIESIAFSADGGLLLTSNLRSPLKQRREDSRRITLWRTSDFKKVSSFGEHPIGISSACFSPDGQCVAFGANDASGGVRVGSDPAVRAKLQRLFPGFRTEKVVDVHLHDVISMTPVVRIWNTVSRREEPALQLPKGRVTAVAFSPDGCLLASSGSSLTLWDFPARKVVRELNEGPNAFSMCVSFSPNGTILASGGGYQFQPGSPYQDCGVKLWDSRSGQLGAFLPHERPVHSVCFSPDGRKLVAGGESGELLMWDIESAC